MEKQFVDVGLELIPIYTFTGIKTLYKLSDNTYGQFLIFKNGKPHYVFDVFDELYKNMNHPIITQPLNYLKKISKAVGAEFRMSQGIKGILSSKTRIKYFTLEKLPISLIVKCL